VPGVFYDEFLIPIPHLQRHDRLVTRQRGQKIIQRKRLEFLLAVCLLHDPADIGGGITLQLLSQLFKFLLVHLQLRQKKPDARGH